MATLRNTVTSTSVLTSLGGTVANTDTLIFQEGGTRYLSGGGLSAYDLTAIEFTEGFRGRLDAALGGNLQVVVNQTGTGYVVNRSPSERIDMRSASVSGVINKITHSGTGTMGLTFAACPLLIQTSGTMIVGDDANVTTLVMDGPTAALNLDTEASYAVTTIEANQGVGRIGRPFTTMNVRRAKVTLDSSSIAATTLSLDGGELYVKNAATVGTFNGRAGLIDFTLAERVPVFTTSLHHPGLTIRLRWGQATPTWGTLTATYGDAKVVRV